MTESTAWLDMHQSLTATGGYTTSAALRPSGMDRAMRRFDGWLAVRVLTTTLWGWWVARRGRYDMAAWARHSARIVRAFECCGMRMTIENMGPLLRHNAPVVYAANHMSMLETLVLPAMVLNHGPVAFVVKRSLLRYPCFGAILRSVHPIAVDRRHPREDFKTVMDAGLDSLARGRSVLIFPQSTRMTVFDPSRFNSLAVKLARRAEVSVVPLALKTDFLGVGRWVRDFGPVDRSKHVYFRFGAPMRVEGTGRETHAAVERFIADSLRGWGGRVAVPGGASDG